MEPQPNQDQQFKFKSDKLYRCRPSLNKSIVVGSKLIDIDGTLLQFFNISDHSFIRSVEALHKADQYYAKLSALSDNIIIIFGVSKLVIFKIDQFKVVHEMSVDGFIEHSGTRKGYAYTLTTEEDGQMKIMNCWQIDPSSGQLIKKFPAIDFSIPEFEDCSDDNITTTMIMSIDKHPKVYVYWKGTNQIVEVDPIKGLSEKFVKTKTLVYICDVDDDSYAEISHNMIHISSKKTGKEIAKLFSPQEKYETVCAGFNNDCLYSTSNKGVKKWQLKSNAQAEFLTESDKYPIEQLFFNEKEVIGINTETKNFIVWADKDNCKISSFPTQIVRRILKINQTQAFLLLEATSSSEEEDEHHVNKYNKMQIYDFAKDIEIAKKAVLKFEYHIDVNSAVVCPSDTTTIRFILNEDSADGLKKYIFRWSPFVEEKKKEIKKREVIGAKDFDIIKIFSFDRILAVNKAKEEDTYSLFNKGGTAKNQILLFDFNAKNFGSYDITHTINDVEMNSENQLYIIGPDKLSIYNIDSSKKNRLEKVQQLEMSISMARPFGQYLLVRREDSCLLYDQDFELVMKETVDETEKQFELFPISPKKFILKTESHTVLWDIEDESAEDVEGIPSVSPLLSELMGGNIIVSDKCINAYGIDKI